MMWMENEKQKLLPKNKGESLMISGFVCDCHGFMSNDLLGDDLILSYQFFKAGKSREGKFTNQDLVNEFSKI
jgi:hypothetical protein